MAYDVFSGTTTNRDWSLMASDLPASAHGYSPHTFWRPPEMEAKLAEIMSQPKGFLTSEKPTRPEAIKMLASYMKANKIGPSDVAGGIGAEVGSLVLSAKDRDKLLNKIDDARFDMRNLRFTFGNALFAIAGGLTFLGLTKVYETNHTRR
jgi:hypothetical protein